MKYTLHALLVSLLLSFNAWAMTLQDAKNNALVGEQINGYLAVITSSAEVEALVTDINAKRLQHYQRIAQKNGLSTASVAKLAAEKAIEAANTGHIYQDKKGIWQTK